MRRRRSWLLAMGILAALGLLTWGVCAGSVPEPSAVLSDATSESSGDASAEPGESSSAGALLTQLEALGEAGGNVEVGDRALQATQAIERVMGELGEAHAFEREGEVPEVASWVLEGYRDGGATLFEASYLDFLGRVWGCVVADAGWVDVCCVREAESGSSLVEVVRLDAQTWERALAEDSL